MPPRACRLVAAAAELPPAAAVFPPLCLGSLTLSSCAILSPMESVSDVGFRRLCHEQGAALTWTEMVRAAALSRGNAATLDLVDTYDADVPTGLQLLAKSGAELRAALRRLEEYAQSSAGSHVRNIVAVDVNLGCPSPDVIRSGAGPALLKRRTKLQELFDALVEWRSSPVLTNVKAVGVKIRLGLNQVERDAKVYLPLAELAAAASLDFLTVHARHAGQRSSDAPDWSAIAEIRAAVPARLVVIGNGNVFNAKDAAAMRTQTGCDGVMLARAAMRNPWCFNDFRASSAPAAAADVWDGGRTWPSSLEVQAAAFAYRATAKRHGTKAKYVRFHEQNLTRLALVAAKGDRSLAVPSPRDAALNWE